MSGCLWVVGLLLKLKLEALTVLLANSITLMVRPLLLSDDALDLFTLVFKQVQVLHL